MVVNKKLSLEFFSTRLLFVWEIPLGPRTVFDLFFSLALRSDPLYCKGPPLKGEKLKIFSYCCAIAEMKVLMHRLQRKKNQYMWIQFLKKNKEKAPKITIFSVCLQGFYFKIFSKNVHR